MIGRATPIIRHFSALSNSKVDTPSITCLVWAVRFSKLLNETFGLAQEHLWEFRLALGLKQTAIRHGSSSFFAAFIAFLLALLRQKSRYWALFWSSDVRLPSRIPGQVDRHGVNL